MASSIDFPSNPVDEQTHTQNDIVYIYNATKGVWKVLSNEDINEKRILSQSDVMALSIALS